ncbi:hypothetical protein [Kitasatospora sp. NPDC088548]|uniref:hypothetical protein n=1 Tax=Kitasatospora sp. NPDC088548 TaxID=3364075 RepID=UPI00381EE11D
MDDRVPPPPLYPPRPPGSPPRDLRATLAATPENLHNQAGPVPGDATRYLCAAAWLDRGFRAEVIEELVEQSFRIPAPSPGADLVRVLHEALTARRWEAWTGAACLAVLAAGFPLFGPEAGITAAVAALVLGAAGGFGADRMDHRLGLSLERLTVARAPRRPGRGRAKGGLSGTLTFLVALSALAVAFTYLRDQAGRLDPDTVARAGYAVAELVLLWLIAAGLRLAIRRRLAGPVMRPAGPPPQPNGKRAAWLYQRLREQQSGPELLYRRRAPLVGLGLPGPIWRMTFELQPSAARVAEGRPAEPIDASALYRAVAARVRALAEDTRYPEDPLRGLSVTDRVFRPSLRVDDPRHWRGRMSAHAGDRILLEPAWADLLSRSGHERLRHYLAIRVGSWQEEVVVTVLVRATTRGGLLHLEWLPYVLPPVDPAYHVIDALGRHSGPADAANALGWAARRLGGDIAVAVGQLGEVWSSRGRAASLARRYRQVTSTGYAVDYAPRLSVRELGSAAEYQNIFQSHDVQRFLGTVTQRVFSAVGEELRARGYDSAAFEKQSQSITNINNGVVVSGSTVNGPVAGGAGSSVHLEVPKS